MIDPHSQLENLINAMKSNDMLLLAHEPMNTKSATFNHIFMKIVSK